VTHRYALPDRPLRLGVKPTALVRDRGAVIARPGGELGCSLHPGPFGAPASRLPRA